MADREIVLKLKADVGQYVAGTNKAAKATKDVGDAAQAASRTTTNSLAGMGQAASKTGGSISSLASGAKSSTSSLNGIGKAASAASKDVDSLGKSLDRASTASGGMKGTATQAEQGAKGLQRLSASVRENRDAWDGLSSKAMIGGVAIATGIGFASKAAIDWESAWAGVQKTVDGTPEQMAELEDGLRGLAKQLPATHAEIAGVAEAAGQLGVAREDILGFTETAIALGESTNLSAEQAAESLAKFSNIMGTASREGVEGYERLGATLVALGNDGASTEADIMQMALRLAGAGKQIGATEADILAMSNALSSVGIEAELGGGAMSRAMLQMNTAVISGGEELDKFAEIAGMSASDFATSWRKDPIAATNAFVTGLGRIGESGGDAAKALDDVGLGGTQNAQVLLRAAGASDLLTESLELGADAWKANAALQEEASKRYETDASKIQIATNSMKDAAIDAGAVFGPMLAGIAGKAAGVADAFVKLPDPIKQVTSGLAGVTAAALLLGGGTIKAIGFAQDLRDSFNQIGASSPRAEKGMRGVAKAGAALGVFLLAREAIGGLQAAFDEAVPSAEALSLALDNLHESGDLSEINKGIQNLDIKKSSVAAVGIQDMGEAVQFLNNQTSTDKTRDWVQGIVGMDSDVDRITQYVEGLDQALADMYSQDPTKARETWATMVTETRKAGGSIEDLRAEFPLAAAAAERAAQSGNAYEEHLANVEQEAQDAEQALQDMQNALEMLGGGFRAEQAAMRQVQESLKGIKEVAKDGGGWTEMSAAMESAAGDALSYAAAQAEMGRGSDVIAAGIQRTRDQIIQSGIDSGKSRAFMEQYADAIGLIPSQAKTIVEAAGVTESTAHIMAMGDQIQLLSGKTVTVKQAGAMEAKGKVLELDGSILGLKGKTVKVTEIGSTASGDRVVQLGNKIWVLKGKDVTVTAKTQGEQALANLQAQINRMSGRDIHVNTYMNEYRSITDMGTYKARAHGGLDVHGVTKMAQGGMIGPGQMRPGIYKTRPGGILMAEDTTAPAEAYISLRKDLEPRSRMIASEVVGMLGGQVMWGDVTAMASGGIYSRWQSQLRNVQALSNRYRWEDGSRQIQVFEDGTARWRGWGAPPAAVSRAINALNAAQDRHEAELNRQEAARRQAQQRQARQRAAQQKAQQRQAQQKAAQEKAARRQAELQRRMAEQRRIAREGWSESTGKKYAGRSFVRSDSIKPSPHEGRTYVAPSVSSRGSSGSGGSGGIDGRQVGAQVAAAVGKEMRSWKPMVEISGQRFYGLMVKTKRDRKGR